MKPRWRLSQQHLHRDKCTEEKEKKKENVKQEEDKCTEETGSEKKEDKRMKKTKGKKK